MTPRPASPGPRPTAVRVAVPLLLLLASVLGFVLRGDPALEERVLASALSQFPVIGGSLGSPERLGGRGVGLAVGLAGALYGGVNFADDGQHAPLGAGGSGTG